MSVIGIIGAGRVGTALALSLARKGQRVAAIASRRDNGARALARRIAGAQSLSARDLVAQCDWVFLAVPDAAVAALAAELPWRTGQAVIHTSGALDLSALDPAAARDALPGGFHPLRAFAGDAGDNAFAGVTVGIAAGPALSPQLESLAGTLGARALRIDGADRALYHAAAVFASNFAIALLVAARQAWTLAGLPEAEARNALAPLLEGAAANARTLPLEKALSGPIARGEHEAIKRHLEKLARAPELADVYRALGAQLLDLELGHSREVRDALRWALVR